MGVNRGDDEHKRKLAASTGATWRGTGIGGSKGTRPATNDGKPNCTPPTNPNTLPQPSFPRQAVRTWHWRSNFGLSAERADALRRRILSTQSSVASPRSPLRIPPCRPHPPRLARADFFCCSLLGLLALQTGGQVGLGQTGVTAFQACCISACWVSQKTCSDQGYKPYLAACYCSKSSETTS